MKHGTPIDLWIDAVPEDMYKPCPCGCGRKMKFVLPEIEEHEKRFVAQVRVQTCALISVSPSPDT